MAADVAVLPVFCFVLSQSMRAKELFLKMLKTIEITAVQRKFKNQSLQISSKQLQSLLFCAKI